MTDNHDYETPSRGATDWHRPLNANFEQLDADVELRGTVGTLSEHTPKVGAKFLATDTGVVYVGAEIDAGDGTTTVEWVPTGLLADGDSFGNEALGAFALVYGGLNNRASGDRATVLGGKGNVASGRGAVAAGVGAHAVHDGAAVFGDHTSREVRSRSTGELRSQMPVYAPSFHTTSARARKTDVEPVDPGAVLAGVEALEISTWRLADRGSGGDPQAGIDADAPTAEGSVDGDPAPDPDDDTGSEVDGGVARHMGPMAAEFGERFGLGRDDGSIATVDADGVALAAVQGLAARLDDERATIEADGDTRDDRLEAHRERIASLETENERLRERTTELEQRLAALEGRLDDAGDGQ